MLGGFILIDKLSNATVGCGMLHFALRRSLNIHRQHLDVGRETHAALKGQRPAVLWFTGLSGAGKSTIANIVERKLAARGRHTFLLDGDNVRHGLNRDLGFTEADRIENIRRVGEVARLMADAGLIVLTAFISPFRAEREMVRKMLPEGEFIEMFVDTPLAEAEKPRRQGPVRQGARRRAQEFHGHRQPLRTAGKAGDQDRHDGDERRCGSGSHRRRTGQAALIDAGWKTDTAVQPKRLRAVTASMRRLLIGLVALLPAWGAADAQDSRDIRVRVGAGAQLRPEYVGADGTSVGPLFHVNLAKGTKPFAFAAPDDSPSIAVTSADGLLVRPGRELRRPAQGIGRRGAGWRCQADDRGRRLRAI